MCVVNINTSEPPSCMICMQTDGSIKSAFDITLSDVTKALYFIGVHRNTFIATLFKITSEIQTSYLPITVSVLILEYVIALNNLQNNKKKLNREKKILVHTVFSYYIIRVLQTHRIMCSVKQYLKMTKSYMDWITQRPLKF